MTHPARRGTLAGLLAVTLALVAAPLRAEDIDIFSVPPSTSDLPSVLIVVDNQARWDASLPVPNCYYKEDGRLTNVGPPANEQDKKTGLEKCALYNVVDSLPVGPGGTARVAVGLMLFNESGSPSGGYPRRAILPLTQANKAALKAAIAGISMSADKGNGPAFAKSLYEAYLYFAGREPYVGTRGNKWDRAAVRDGRYVPPSTSGCAPSTIIFIANSGPGDSTNNEARALLRGAGGNDAEIPYARTAGITSSDQGNWADEFARFLSTTDVGSAPGRQSITVHTVAVTGASSDNTSYPSFVRAIAKQGGGTFLEARNADQLEVGLGDVFNQVLAVNTSFASASLPISVNARGTYRNQIFMGMLRPSTNPRWRGNLKQYRFAYDAGTSSLEIVDQNGASAISAESGFVRPSAVSYWTTSSAFWANEPAGTPPSASDAPDGEVVEKGGAAQRLRELYVSSQAGRVVFTCPGCTSVATALSAAAGSRTSFAASNPALTPQALGVATQAAATQLIDWVRGQDNAEDEKGPGGTATIRPSVHGDVLHSRPAVITYGDRVVVYYGANDGMLHAIEGTQTAPAGGRPLWGFVPEESYPKLERLRADAPGVQLPTTPSGSGAQPRDYFVDGSVSVYQKLDASGTTSRAVIYFGMRRGGRAVYALDVTNADQPRFLWKVTNAEIPSLGYTWSEPKVARVAGRTNPVVVMGAGYDPTEDTAAPGTPTMGNAILVLDAITGEALARFETARPVPSDVALVDSDFDGLVDRAYVGDLGGTLYRVDFESTSSRGAWSAVAVARLGSSGGRKLFFPPDVVITRKFAIVLTGSGDREKPLATTSRDFFYTLLDRNVGKTVPDAWTPIEFASLAGASPETTSDTMVGCALALNTAGEKVVNAPVTVGGITYFSTNTPTPPSPGTCTTNLGLAQSYALPLLCEEPEVETQVGGGLPPSPVTGVVEVQVTDAGTHEAVTRLVPFIIGGHNEKHSAIEGSEVKPPIVPRRQRLYWFFDRDR